MLRAGDSDAKAAARLAAEQAAEQQKQESLFEAYTALAREGALRGFGAEGAPRTAAHRRAAHRKKDHFASNDLGIFTQTHTNSGETPIASRTVDERWLRSLTCLPTSAFAPSRGGGGSALAGVGVAAIVLAVAGSSEANTLGGACLAAIDAQLRGLDE